MEGKTKLFIADSNDDFRTALCAVLKNESNIEIAGTASDGVEALRGITELSPDILLIDVVLARLGGISVIQHVMAELSKPPLIIVASALTNERVVSEVASLGAAYFLAKPCDLDDLLFIKDLTLRFFLFQLLSRIRFKI